MTVHAPRSTLHADLGFDPDALREKDRKERDERIRPDGNEQHDRWRATSTSPTSSPSPREPEPP